MANTGKFIDRNPHLISAGKETEGLDVTTKDCLQYASLEDKVTALKHEQGISEDVKRDYPEAKLKDTGRYAGFDTQVKQIFHDGLKPPFQHLEEEIKETTYGSYWKSLLGKVKDQVPGLPEGTDIQTKTFGMPTKQEITAAELVSPQKLPGQVLFESNLAHELYLKSHQDYYVGERVNRGYKPPGFNPEYTFGDSNKADFTGKNARRIMNWRNNDKTCEVSARLACFKKERKPHLGETFEPNHVLGTCVPETFRFGIRRDKKYGVAELMKDSKPCAAKKDLMDCMVHIIALRDGLNKVYPPFEFNQLLRVLKEYDKDDKGWVAKDVIHEVCKNFKIQTHKEKLEEFMKHAGIMDCNNYVDYKKFCELINLQYELPILKKLNDVPPENLHFETTYHGLLYDKKCDNSGMRPAGVPSNRTDVPQIVAEYKFDKVHLGQETDVRALINPSIFTQYGLSHRNFFKPQDKKTMQKILLAIGVQIPDDLFEAIWKEAYKCDNTGGVCVETFRNFLDKMAAEHVGT